MLPCGLDTVVPNVNRQLAEEILETGGCLISEYPVGTSVKKYQYVARDRLQSGISEATIVIEAQIKSGTMHTAEFASKQQKRLLCYSHNLLTHSSGNLYLEQKGLAEPINNEKDLQSFLTGSFSPKVQYEQMTLPFIR